ncbi:hypothetical protein GIB67_015654 [Kingdonia uniflora]|uniref:Protein kinase domain-containing protein n=1 Tax=Kingdonia uniflora TaxID=39325 RepID=A0A7J7NUP8_9MAGN|nr:hypothetical protein GIB67_015654 [Kingdonia uniflora]
MDKIIHGRWKKGEVIGKGTSATVSLATPDSNMHHLPPIMAGEDFTSSEENVVTPETNYNLLLAFAPGGTVADQIMETPEGLPEDEVMGFTRSILRGLHYVHSNRYVHCDIKPGNLLLFPLNYSKNEEKIGFEVKIADFGSAKRSDEELSDGGDKRLRGTSSYIAPESVAYNIYEPTCDVWALGCVVLEMLTGKPAWEKTTLDAQLQRIGYSDELPVIPKRLSRMARDFLSKTLVRDTELRWTASMLLRHHPFCFR